jgi:CheY-like chemotaxis protein
MLMKKKILMVDDERDFCHFVKLNLERSGKYQVYTAYNGADGVAEAVKSKPDLILLDVVMHDMDGGEVAWHLLNDSATKGIPIIFLTAVLKATEAEQLRGGHQFLSKPITPEKLMNKIDARLGLSPGGR